MKIPQNLFLIIGIMPIFIFSFSSCEDVNKAQFQHAYTDVAGDASPDARDAMNKLTRNGKTLPTGAELTSAISNPGNCAACNAAAHPSKAKAKEPNWYPTALKNYPIPAKGCLPKDRLSVPEAEQLMYSQGLRAVNATSSEKKALGAAIMRVQQLNGGPLKLGMGPGGNYPFIFKDASGSWQGGDGIHIGRGGHDCGNSVAQHVHEWAHLIGNQGGYAMFKKYMAGNGTYTKANHCLVSGYADNVTSSGRIEGEQFAEVFTAFITQPSLLINNTRTPNNCRMVYKFFKDKFFKRGSLVESCL